MTNRPALVVGASGLAGRRVLTAWKAGGTAVGTYLTRGADGLIPLDITNRAAVIALAETLRPAVIVCAAAIPSVERCEAEPAVTRAVNVVGTLHLVDATAAVNAMLVYFSSEYVFDGTSGPYTEERATKPLNEYGRQKVECEEAIQRLLARYLIVRTSGVYDWEPGGKNFVMQVLERLSRGEPMRVPADQIITPTYATNLGDAVTDLIRTGAVGTFHVAGSTPVNRAEFAYLVADTFGLNRSLLAPAPTEDLGLLAPRPRSAGLSVAKAAALIRRPLLSPREGLRSMRRRRDGDWSADSR